jgi:hypothetical protein
MAKLTQFQREALDRLFSKATSRKFGVACVMNVLNSDFPIQADSSQAKAISQLRKEFPDADWEIILPNPYSSRYAPKSENLVDGRKTIMLEDKTTIGEDMHSYTGETLSGDESHELFMKHGEGPIALIPDGGTFDKVVLDKQSDEAILSLIDDLKKMLEERKKEREESRRRTARFEILTVIKKFYPWFTEIDYLIATIEEVDPAFSAEAAAAFPAES